MSGTGDMGAMNRYVTLQPLGDGTYGSVMLGQRVDTGEKVTADHCHCTAAVGKFLDLNMIAA